MSGVDGGAAAGLPLTLALQSQIDTPLRALVSSLGDAAPSECAFANLYLFRAAHAYRFHAGAWPGIAGRTYDGERHYFPLFDAGRAPPAVLRALIAEHGCLFPVPASGLATLDPAAFAWDASRDDADYVYPLANFLHYRGRVLQKRRNLMKRLLATHEITAVPLDAGTADAARAVLAHWMSERAKAPGEADETPCLEAIAHHAALGLAGTVYRVDGEAAGFTLTQPLGPRVHAVRFAKGSDRFKGIYQTMFHLLATALPPGTEWLNFEQDMGVANFRRSKQSYQPATLLHKFRVRLRDTP